MSWTDARRSSNSIFFVITPGILNLVRKNVKCVYILCQSVFLAFPVGTVFYDSRHCCVTQQPEQVALKLCWTMMSHLTSFDSVLNKKCEAYNCNDFTPAFLVFLSSSQFIQLKSRKWQDDARDFWNFKRCIHPTSSVNMFT